MLVLFMNPLNLLSPRALPNPDFFSDCGCAKLPNAPIGGNAPPCPAAHGEAALLGPNGAVVVRLRLPKGPVFSAPPLSFSYSSPAPPAPCSLKSVRRRTRAGGGVTALVSSRANRDAEGDASEFEGSGKASLVSRRRVPGRTLVGDARPHEPPPPEMDVLRRDGPSFGLPSLLVFCPGCFRGEFTEEAKS